MGSPLFNACVNTTNPPSAVARILKPLRLGLCCQFADEPIKFRTTTAAACRRLSESARRSKLSELCRHNAEALYSSLAFCAAHHIGAFRVNSQILPLATHPELGYQLEQLPDGAEIIDVFLKCGAFAAQHDLRKSFHPDQFVVLSTPREDVAARSIAEIEYQAQVAQWIGADVVNIHAGGVYDGKTAALDRFASRLALLSESARRRLTVENDDKLYSPADLLPWCRHEGVPLVYDVHHHRCLRDGLDEQIAATSAARTWDREPMVHISSPKDGWAGPQPNRHHDYIDPADFPAWWLGQAITVEVEAKAKELAIARLQAGLAAAAG